jgi:hypothetical protein
MAFTHLLKKFLLLPKMGRKESVMKTMRKMSQALLLGTLIFFLPFTLVGRAAAQTFNAASDFSLVSNPNSVWSYGFSSTPASSLEMLYATTSTLTFGNPNWESWRANIGVDGTPLVVHNTGPTQTNSGTVNLLVGQLAMHPGSSCQLSFVRWTAPGDGVITIVAEFSGRDFVGPTTTDVRVLHNGTPLLSGLVNGFGPGSGPSMSTTLSVLPDDTIDFAVGCGSNGNFFFDTTGLDATITFTLSVSIDIKPGSFRNSINPQSLGLIPVAILTTNSFDATTVDPMTVLFGASGTEAAPVHSALEDLDGDGDTDIILHFKTPDTGIECGDASASLTGETFSGQMIQGSDSIKTAGCK